MKVPAAMLRRVEALELRAEPAKPRAEWPKYLTIAEALDVEQILIAAMERRAGRGPAQGPQPSRVCSHHQLPVPRSLFEPQELQRIEEFDRAITTRMRAAAEGRFAELPSDVRRRLEDDLEDDRELRAP